MSNQSSTTTNSTTRSIPTVLKGKNELFRILALAESTGHPLLFVGVPGVGKTNAVTDYSKSKVNNEDHTDKIFMIEADEDTRPSELKGMPDMKKLYEEGVYQKVSELPSSDVIIVNEIDKAESAFRNGLLSIMNEKSIFDGSTTIDCNWKLFVATCNVIPEEEVGSPFWDRFVLKQKVNRATKRQLIELAIQGKIINTIDVKVPTREEIDSVVIPENYMSTFVDVVYKSLSDRTITHAADLIRAVSIIWNCSIKKAMTKVAALLGDVSLAKEVSSKIQSPEMREIMNQLTSISFISDPNQSRDEFIKLANTVEKLYEEKVISKDDVDEFAEVVKNFKDNKNIKE